MELVCELKPKSRAAAPSSKKFTILGRFHNNGQRIISNGMIHSRS